MRCVAPGSSAEQARQQQHLGLVARARAMHSRCCWPPAVGPGLCTVFDFVPQRRLPQCPLTRSAISALRRQAVQPRAVATLSKMLLGKGFGAWNTIPTRAAADGIGAFENTRRPRAGSRPVRVLGISSFNRFTERRKVALAAAEGPIRAVTAAAGNGDRQSNNAWVAPYQKLYARTSMMVVGRSDGGRSSPPGPPLRNAERGNAGVRTPGRPLSSEPPS